MSAIWPEDERPQGFSGERRENAACQDCGRTFSAQICVLMGREILRQRRCPGCVVVAAAAELAAMSPTGPATDPWAEHCPAAYRGTDMQHPGLAPEFRRAALEWDPRGAIGLGLCGATGRGKTRCGYHALRRAWDAGYTVEAISHLAFGRLAANASAGERDERADARRRMARLERVGVLLLDDLGKLPSATERANAELWGLVEARTAAGLRIIYTMQGAISWLEPRMGPDIGPALARRLREFCGKPVMLS